ncbi:sodium:solute symporter family protein [Candidatus Dojkabacteria bacterium]|uniref:Sodium:solute symporter family protein n=1 Tax=Candidatus Dojkabacteria bacterium TaxID=2099670 RepID=A0A955RKG1_9BACT|nr:sodium:solute symporter family protein [Candidatus Dojkabacteria bacterium]
MLNYILLAIFFGYLIFESLTSFKEVRSINSFSLGIKAISTYALGATITATWVSGSGFILDLTEFYTRGLLYFLESVGMILGLIIMSMVLVPRMERYLGTMSVATIMGDEYGQIVRVITALSGCLVIAGGLYIQFKIMGQVLFYMFPYMNPFFWTCISSILVIGYTFSGGINSVVHTDKIQAICFVISLLVGAIIISTNITPIPPKAEILDNLGKQFTLAYFGTLTSQELLDAFLIFGYFIVPGLSPQTVQRIAMGINIKQVKKAYLWSSFLLFLVLFLSCYISYILYQKNPNLKQEQILPYLLEIFSFDGTRAILAIGIIAMCMSTADSNLNIGAVLIANDTYKCNTLTPWQKLIFARYTTLALGLVSLIFCYKQGSFLQLLLFSKTFYVPLITVPLWAAIFKFKTTQRCCLITIFLTFLYIVIYKFILHPKLNIIVYAMIFNGITLFTTHYILEKWELLKCFGITGKLKEQ